MAIAADRREPKPLAFYTIGFGGAHKTSPGEYAVDCPVCRARGRSGGGARLFIENRLARLQCPEDCDEGDAFARAGRPPDPSDRPAKPDLPPITARDVLALATASSTRPTAKPTAPGFRASAPAPPVNGRASANGRTASGVDAAGAPRSARPTPAPKPADRPEPESTRPRAVIQSGDALLKKTFPTPDPIVPGVVYEGLTLFAGPPKVGKSWFGLALAVAVATGGYALGSVPVEPGDVLHMALEDGERRVQGRLRELLAGASTPLDRLQIATHWPTFDNGGLEAVEQWIRLAERPRLVIIDTIQRVRPASRANETLYAVDYGAIAPLSDLIQLRSGLAALVICHTRKLGADDPIDLVSGTHGLTAAGDGAIVLRRDRATGEGFLSVIHRDADDDRELLLRRDPAIGGWRLIGDAAEHAGAEGRQDIRAVLREAGKPLGPKAIAEALYDGEAIGPAWERHYLKTRQTIGRMADAGQLQKSGRGHYAASNTPCHIGHNVTMFGQNSPGCDNVTDVTPPTPSQWDDDPEHAQWARDLDAPPPDDPDADPPLTRQRWEL